MSRLTDKRKLPQPVQATLFYALKVDHFVGFNVDSLGTIHGFRARAQIVGAKR